MKYHEITSHFGRNSWTKSGHLQLWLSGFFIHRSPGDKKTVPQNTSKYWMTKNMRIKINHQTCKMRKETKWKLVKIIKLNSNQKNWRSVPCFSLLLPIAGSPHNFVLVEKTSPGIDLGLFHCGFRWKHWHLHHWKSVVTWCVVTNCFRAADLQHLGSRGVKECGITNFQLGLLNWVLFSEGFIICMHVYGTTIPKLHLKRWTTGTCCRHGSNLSLEFSGVVQWLHQIILRYNNQHASSWPMALYRSLGALFRELLLPGTAVFHQTSHAWAM